MAITEFFFDFFGESFGARSDIWRWYVEAFGKIMACLLMETVFSCGKKMVVFEFPVMELDWFDRFVRGNGYF